MGKLLMIQLRILLGRFRVASVASVVAWSGEEVRMLDVGLCCFCEKNNCWLAVLLITEFLKPLQVLCFGHILLKLVDD